MFLLASEVALLLGPLIGMLCFVFVILGPQCHPVPVMHPLGSSSAVVLNLCPHQGALLHSID